MKWKLALLTIIGGHLLLLAKMVFFPYPELFLYPYLANHGFLPYAQIFDQHFPSILMLPVNISTFGLTTPAAARLFSLGIVFLTQILLFLIARKIFKSEKKALLVNLFYLFVQPTFEGYILWIDSFIAPISLAAFYFLWKYFDKSRARDVFLAGLFLGVTVFIKQSMLPLAAVVGLVLLIRRKNIKSLFLYAIGMALPILPLLVWLAKKGLFPDFIYWTVKFNLEIYPKMAGKLPTLKQALRVVVFFAPAALIFLTKARNKIQNILAAIFVVFSLGAAGNRFELVHLQPALPFVALLTADFAEFLRKKSRLFLVVGLFLAAAFLAGYIQIKLIRNYVYYFDAETLRLSSTVQKYAKPGEKVYFEGSQPIAHFLADRLPPGGVFSVSLPWNMVAVQAKIAASLKTDPPAVVVRDVSGTLEGMIIGDYMQEIDAYVLANYQVADKVGGSEVMVLKKTK